MTGILLTKTRRDLRRRLAQFAAVGLTVFLGVLLFVATYAAYRNLDTSYQRTYQRLSFADLTATGGDPDRVAAAVRSSDGVAAVATRTRAQLPVVIGGDKLLGQVIGAPVDRPAAVDRVDVIAGDRLSAADPDGVLVEQHTAKTFDLVPGDGLRVFDGSGWRALTVRGVVDSPEYLYPASNRQNVLGDPHSFAAVFAPEQTVQTLAGTAATRQTLVRLRDPGAAAQVTDQLRAAGATAVQAQADQASNAVLQQDLTGYSELSVAFPALFLTAAAIAAYVLITRLVLAERRVIATFLAAGVSRATVVRHYLGHGVITGTVAAVLGVVAGTFATAAVTDAYTTGLGIPDTVVRQHPFVALLGVLFGLVVGLVGGAAPALATSRVAPAEAMRGGSGTQRPPGRLGLALSRTHRLPVSWRLALRELTRSRRRTVATMAGTVLSLILVLVSAGMITSMKSMLDVQFTQIQRADVTVTAEPSATGLPAALSAVAGVAAVEPTTTTSVTAVAGDRSYATSLTGFRADTAMHGFRGTDGRFRDLPTDGVLAGSALADRLDVAVGDTITVAGAGAESHPVRLAGLLDEPIGTALYGTVDTVAEVTGTTPNGYLLRLGPGDVDRDRVRADVSGLPGVVAYTDGHALYEQVQKYLGLFWIFVGIMLVLGAILALTVIYVTMTVNIAERTTELATLRAAGVRTSRIAGLLATENVAAVLLAVPLGLAAGALAAWAALRAFHSDLFSIQLKLGWPTLLAAGLAVVAASLVSQLPAVRAVRRLDIARVVRERAL